MKRVEKILWNYGFFKYVEMRKRVRKRRPRRKILPPG